MRSAATTSIVARSATVRGLRSLSSRITSSMVTLVGSGAVWASAERLVSTASDAATSASPRNLLIVDLDCRYLANERAVEGGKHEQRDGDGRDKPADDHDGERTLGLAADAGRDRHRRQAEDREHRRHEHRAEAAGGAVRQRGHQ